LLDTIQREAKTNMKIMKGKF